MAADNAQVSPAVFPANPLQNLQVFNDGLKHFCFDLETGHADKADILRKMKNYAPKNVKDPEKIRAKKIEAFKKTKEKDALLDSSPIVCLAVATNAGNALFECIKNQCPPKTIKDVSAEIHHYDGEKEMLLGLAEWMTPRVTAQTVLVGFNIRGFDLPKLRSAFIRQRVPLPDALIPGVNEIYDVMKNFTSYYSTEYYRQEFVKLREVLECFKLPTYKEVVTGAMVPDLAEQGQSEVILSYNYLDAVATYQAFLLMTGQQQML